MAEILDLDSVFKLKVDGLKQELGKRGLSKTGSKAELQERLIQYVSTHDSAALLNADESECLDDNTEDEELKKELEESLEKLDTPVATEDGQTPLLTDSIIEHKEEEQVLKPTPGNDQKENNIEVNTTKKIVPVKIVSVPLSEEQRKGSRTKRFGGAVSEVEKKKSRLERFSNSSSTANTEKSESTTKSEEEKISKRAERFGAISSVSVTKNLSQDDRLKKRQERFADEKIKKRQERFGVIQSTKPSSDMEMRKQKRAMKFGI